MSEEQSATIGAIAKALAAAQGELGDAKKDRVNPAFKSKYATLASVRAAMSEVLPKHELAVVQSFEPHGDAGVCVVTKLVHASGEWFRSSIFMPVTKKDAHGFGSALTYARRYSLAAIVGIATDDDDDANDAVKPSVVKTTAPAPIAAPEAPAAGDVPAEYVALIDGAAAVPALMAIHAKFTSDAHVSPAAKTYLTTLCSLKRKKLEGKPVAA